ncbi:MAG: hypothetical protein ACOYMR_15660 [Ilumatobacteraceae bacterium]
MQAPKFDTRMLARWSASFVGFPLAGLAAKAVAGPIDSTAAALTGGLAAGAVLGLVQSLALRASTRRRLQWVAATAIGLSAGLTLGAELVDHATDTASLVVMGAITGAGIGVAQSLVMAGPAWRRVVWLVLTPALWALGWLITSQVIVDVDARYANFGASGALVCAVIGGVVLASGRVATP